MTLNNPTKVLAPVQKDERINIIDSIRGFAILGILIANMVSYSGQAPGIINWSGLDQITVILTELLVRAKFYTLFSFLFGWGMSVILLKEQNEGVKFIPLFLKRMVGLLFFGIIHGVFLWSGDILTLYATLGFLLILFRNRSPRALIGFSGGFLILRIVLNLPFDTIYNFTEWYNQFVSPLQKSTYPLFIYATGTYQEIAVLRFQSFVSANSYLLYFIGPVFSMFLLGLYVGKKQYFQNIASKITSIKKTLWTSGILGILFNSIYVITRVWSETNWPNITWIKPIYFRSITIGARTLGAPALMVFYVSVFLLLSQKEHWQYRLQALGNVGRLALSNYIFQTVVGTLIFYNYGFGLYGEIGPFLGLILTIVIYRIQMYLSKEWLNNYQFGPLEWLWRSFTYGKRQPLKHGETYESLRRNSNFERIKGTQTSHKLIGIWIIIILWSGILVSKFNSLADKKTFLDQLLPTDQETHTILQEEAQQESIDQEFIVIPPVIADITYNPGPIVIAGDYISLADAFDEEKALSQIRILSSPPYLGRLVGSNNGISAGNYIADMFEEVGLQPGGDNGTYFQEFMINRVSLAQSPTFSIENDENNEKIAFDPYVHFYPLLYGYFGGGTVEGDVIWVNTCSSDDFLEINAVDKIVFCQANSSVQASRVAVEHGAVGIILLGDPELRPLDQAYPNLEEWIPNPIPGILISPEVANYLIVGSDLTFDELLLHFSSFPLMTRVEISVQTNEYDTCWQDGCIARNVIGVLPGRDPNYSDKVIIIGGHYDHMGETPEDTLQWNGANDNASGIGTLIEIARSWQEQGFIPNYTIMFVAWDAEEIGLVGSQFFINNPRYPLENIFGVINMDMVGAGGEILAIDGTGWVANSFEQIAVKMDVPTSITNLGRSDHQPFLDAEIPAALLIWEDENGDLVDTYHRPTDTWETIDPQKIRTVALIVQKVIFGISEEAPQIQSLLEERSQAVLNNDLPNFQSTAIDELQNSEMYWFDDLQSFNPDDFIIVPTNIQVLGNQARSTIQYLLEYPPEQNSNEDENKTISITFSGQFRKIGNEWKWAGPDLNWSNEFERTDPNFDEEIIIVAPFLTESELTEIETNAKETYENISTQLGLQLNPSSILILYESQNSFRADTGLSLSKDTKYVVLSDVVKGLYSQGVFENDSNFSSQIGLLVLSNLGISEFAPDWIIDGFNELIDREYDNSSIQLMDIPGIISAIENDNENELTSWAKMDYLRRRLGWNGLGRFLTILGEACNTDDCQQALETALRRTINVSISGFEEDWKEDWTKRIVEANESLNSTLSNRESGLFEKNESRFLDTVNSQVRNLFSEQSIWFASFENNAISEYNILGVPIYLYDNGDILARITTNIRVSSSNGGAVNRNISEDILFANKGNSLLWSGPLFDNLRGMRVDIYFPEGYTELAQFIMAETDLLLSELLLINNGFERSGRITIRLYKDKDKFQNSISITQLGNDGLSGWTNKNTAIKLLIGQNTQIQDYKNEIALQLPRNILYNMDVRDEWIINGYGLYNSMKIDGTNLGEVVGNNLWKVGARAKKGELKSVISYSLNDSLSQSETNIALASIWDAIRYIDLIYGNDVLIEFIKAQSRGQSSDLALESTLGLTLDEFELAWHESLIQGHISDEWLLISSTFNSENVLEHIGYIASPEMKGRQAGSPEENLTAVYIAEKFAEYGLEPILEVQEENIENADFPLVINEFNQTLSYFQQFPIEYSTLNTTPQLTLVNQALVEEFSYREDFVIVLNEQNAHGGQAEGELVWVPEEYTEINLSGKIVARYQVLSLAEEIDLAIEHNAIGLILVRPRNLSRDKDLLIKTSIPIYFEVNPSIPVVVLGGNGYEKLQLATGLTHVDFLNFLHAQPIGMFMEINIPLSEPVNTSSANVIGMLPGSDLELKNEVIILGAHYDYVGDDPDTYICDNIIISDVSQIVESDCEIIPGHKYPGLLDNASGVGTLLEIARVWHKNDFQPKRSVLFITWGAQEAGLVGSKYYIDNPVIPLEDTILTFHLDSVGGGQGFHLAAQGSWEEDGIMLYAMDSANDLYDGRLKITREAYVSDQIPFEEIGIPSLLISWNESGDEFNWPEELTYDLDPYRIDIAGNLIMLTIMTFLQ